MKDVVAANTNRTLKVEPTDFDSFRDVYTQRFGPDGYRMASDIRHVKDGELRRQIRSQMGEVQDELGIPKTFPNSVELITALRNEGSNGVVIFAGAPVDRTWKNYRDLGLTHLIDGAFTVPEGYDRKDRATFEKAGEEMRPDFNPKAYLTHDPQHAMAARDGWGKALFCPRPEYDGTKYDPSSGIYLFDWEQMDQQQIGKVLDFVYG